MILPVVRERLEACSPRSVEGALGALRSGESKISFRSSATAKALLARIWGRVAPAFFLVASTNNRIDCRTLRFFASVFSPERRCSSGVRYAAWDARSARDI